MSARSLSVALLLLLSACSRSHSLGSCPTPADCDAGTPTCSDGHCDAGGPVCTDGECDGGGASCGDGLCNPGETPASCSVDCGDPGPSATRTYVVSTIDTTIAVDPSMAYGFDLDGASGGIAGLPCTAAPDFTSRVTGAPSVDNQLSTVFPILDMMIDGGLNVAFQQEIQGGTLLVVLEVSGIDSFTSDPSVQVRAVLARPQMGAMVVTDGSGLAAGQTFAAMTELGAVVGSISDGRLRLQIPTLPLDYRVTGIPLTFTIRDAVIGGRISAAGGLVGGEIGGRVEVDEFVTSLQTFVGGVDRATVEALAMPDLQPDALGEHCASMSIGLGFEPVFATLE